MPELDTQQQTPRAKVQAAADALDLAIKRNRVRGIGIELSIARTRVEEALTLLP